VRICKIIEEEEEEEEEEELKIRTKPSLGLYYIILY